MRPLLPRVTLIGIPMLLTATACTTRGEAVEPASEGTPVAGEPESLPRPTASWLFDGNSLGEFEPTVFGGEGEVTVEGGRLLLDFGNPLTGVTWAGAELPRDEYRLELVARRVEGTDFFCGLTFPVREGHATLVVGGWGGATTGVSCLDGLDASQNETTKYLYFETGVDHAVVVEVAGGRVRCTVGDEAICDVEIEAHDWEVRPEVELSKPLGVCSFATRASLGPIRLTRLAAASRGD